MTDTVRNRSAVLAKFLRAAVKTLTRAPGGIVDAEDYDDAVASVAAVAEELETAAAEPDREQNSDNRDIALETAAIFARVSGIIADGGPEPEQRVELAALLERAETAMRTWAMLSLAPDPAGGTRG